VLVEGDGGTLMQEEIFGPLLPLIAFDRFADALQFMRNRPRPLATYYFGSSRAEIELMSHEVPCGGLVINDLMMHFLQDDLPFGGVGESGMGCYHGREGFARFSHAKSVFRQGRVIDVGRLLHPPYSRRLEPLLQMQIRR
jgi:acyl-CoA reductase-like NAD-dependent aldehyde dehydrogenase